MKEVKFKVGDLVYCPKFTNKIVRLEHRDDEQDFYTLQFVYDETSTATFADNGIENLGSDLTPIIFHATQEKYELLSKLHPNVEFEPPPKRKESKEIIKAMLKAGYDGVPCKTDCKQYRFVCVDVSDDPYFPFVYDNVNGEPDAFSSAIPYCHKTGKTIIDFVDGKCVLENGEVVG